VSSFKSTLAVVRQATLILHLVDAGAEDFEEQMEITANILLELGTADIPRVTVFNKIDTLEPERLDFLRAHHPQAVFISAERRLGLEDLKARIGELYDKGQFATAGGAAADGRGYEAWPDSHEE
jgi:GTP-binding protein HflX